MTIWDRLDYPKAAITMRSVTPWEQKFRIHSCAKEPWTVAWIETMTPETVFWDVGANTGPYALIAAARGIRTVAFEPGYANYSAAQDNVLANPDCVERITVLPLALSDQTALVPFLYRNLEAGAASHAIGGSPNKMVASLPAVAVRADELINVMHMHPPTHLKIDVDGAEVKVLAGFGQCLTVVQAVMIEAPNAGDELNQIHGILSAAGLTMVTIHNQRDGHTIGEIHYEEWRRVP